MRLFLTSFFISLCGFIYSQPCTITNATGCSCPDGTQFCDLLPDIKLTDITLLDQGYHGTIEYSQTGNGPEDGRLRISVSTPNVGFGPLAVFSTDTYVCGTDTFTTFPGICPDGTEPKNLIVQRIYQKNGNTMTYYDRPAGSMTYHPTHNHMHVDDWGVYSLRIKDDNEPDPRLWPIVGTGQKLGFCLMDYGSCSTYLGHCTDHQGNVLGNSHFPNLGLGNSYNCSPVEQGISSGYTDIYYQYLDGMYIDIPPGTCNGEYWLVVEVDPHNFFLESDETNNLIAVPVTLTKQDTVVQTVQSSINAYTGCFGEELVLSATPGGFWAWSTGATTSSITVTQPGIYQVTVTDGCGVHTPDAVEINFVEPNLPVVSGAIAPFQQPAQLEAVCNGTAWWFDSPSSVTPVFKGNSFLTAALTESTTFWVENHISVNRLPVFGGLTETHLYDGSYGIAGVTGSLVFSVFQPSTLVSVKVNANNAGNRTVQLKNSGGSTIWSQTFYLPQGESRIQLDLPLSPGNNYRLTTDGYPGLYQNNANIPYPFAIGNLLTISGTPFGSLGYFYFYDWEVRDSDLECTSQRIAVDVTIQFPDGISSQSEIFPAEIHPNPSAGVFLVTFPAPAGSDWKAEVLNNLGKSIWKSNGQSNNSATKLEVDLSQFSSGLYFFSLQTRVGKTTYKLLKN